MLILYQRVKENPKTDSLQGLKLCFLDCTDGYYLLKFLTAKISLKFLIDWLFLWDLFYPKPDFQNNYQIYSIFTH